MYIYVYIYVCNLNVNVNVGWSNNPAKRNRSIHASLSPNSIPSCHRVQGAPIKLRVPVLPARHDCFAEAFAKKVARRACNHCFPLYTTSAPLQAKEFRGLRQCSFQAKDRLYHRRLQRPIFLQRAPAARFRRLQYSVVSSPR